MLKGGFVEDEEIGEGGDDEVDCCAGNPGRRLEGVIEA